VEQKGQNFGQVQNAYVRVVNDVTNEEIVRYDLAEDYSIETALIFGSIYWKDSEWRFTAVGQGYKGGLVAACRQYGINVA
jgi:tellurium resistance protein TerD